ncbi:hypothetical protein [Amycolatopsis sp.]|uniref:hypothetical protein n=1 Tax=Amycolatopsis sp. TaxID=37632 RepID=UPI002D7EBF2E|nr:hypothetical protein [Amycolatopsis sp.]HET6706582.1 hypothetical protein [Amycolatopsis sp.]
MRDRSARTHRESRAAEQARRDPVRPATGVAGLLYLQRTAGNAAVVQRQQAPWQVRVRDAKANNDRAALFRLVREALPPAIRLVSRIGADRYSPMPVANFDPTLDEFNAEGATVTPEGLTPVASLDPLAPIPELCVVLGRGALRESSPAYTRSVLDHEWRHVAHFRRAFELVGLWHRRGGRRPFPDWLAREQRAGRISTEDLLLARERVESGATGTSVRVGITETYAPLEAFLNDFNAMPLEMPERDLFRQLADFAERWYAPLDAQGRAMQREILGRFRPFRARLDQAHRAAFDRHVAANQAVPFYLRLARTLR